MLKAFLYGTLYICILSNFLVCFCIFNMDFSLLSILFIPCFGYVDRMAFYSFVDGACRHTLSLASAAWVLYSLDHGLISLGVVCISSTTKNVAEYPVVIGLLTEAASWDIHDLVVFMDS